MLGDLVLVHDPPGPQADLACAADAPGAHLAGDRGEELFCGLQEVLAHAGALGGQVGIAAGDEAPAGLVRVAELGEVLLVEQGHLQRPVIGGELADGGGAQAGESSRCRPAL